MSVSELMTKNRKQDMKYCENKKERVAMTLSNLHKERNNEKTYRTHTYQKKK